MIFPDATLGVLGGGQLGRMFTMAAHSMGYQVWVLDPDPHSPAGAIADQHICASYTDQNALDNLAENCTAITTEFENVPAESLQFLEVKTRVRPCAANVAIARDR
ncbi:MAG: 5-(carboxyamino)imidazole ribonucleotide synthase, partial [Gammaproteobacteria bacterium]